MISASEEWVRPLLLEKATFYLMAGITARQFTARYFAALGGHSLRGHCGRRRAHMDFELHASADDEICYDVHVPLEAERDGVTNQILALDPKGHAAVEWSEEKAKAK